MFHSCSDAAVVLLPVSSTIPQTLMHICPDSAVRLSHQRYAQAPNATLLEQICCIDCDPELHNRCPLASKQMPSTLLRLCRCARQLLPDAKAQVSDADAQILRGS
jgi:hypothetical protein